MADVSLIIPCYNHGRHLPRALGSVLSQTFTDWEAIIVDDGSTDNTREAAAQFSDPRIHYIYQENRGLSAARNTGIRLAQGGYLAFLDADDEFEAGFVEVCLKFAASMNAEAVVTRTRFIDSDGNILPAIGGEAVTPDRVLERLLEGGFFPVHAVLAKAETVRHMGQFDESLTSLEDWDLWLRIAAEGGAIRFIPEPLVRYRISPGSMATNATRMHANRMAVLSKHFGPPDDYPIAWLEQKRRAYAFAYRSAALGYLMQQEADTAWCWLTEAARTWPPILSRLDTFYELALGDQPRGYRGQVHDLDLAANGTDVLRRLDALFAMVPASVSAQRGSAYGNAYLALSMLADQAGDWGLARRYLLQAVHAHPHLLRDRSVLRRLLKIILGHRIAARLRHLLEQE